MKLVLQMRRLMPREFTCPWSHDRLQVHHFPSGPLTYSVDLAFGETSQGHALVSFSLWAAKGRRCLWPLTAMYTSATQNPGLDHKEPISSQPLGKLFSGPFLSVCSHSTSQASPMPHELHSPPQISLTTLVTDVLQALLRPHVLTWG